MLKQFVLESLTHELNQGFRFNIDYDQFLKDSRLDIIIYLIDQLEWHKEKKVELITAVQLLQIASDVFQLKSNEHDNWDRSLVLQSDRLNSQAYILLTKHEEIGFIKRMACAIKEINELKIKGLQYKNTEPHRYIQTNDTIKWSFIVYLIEHYELNELKADLDNLKR